MKRKQRLKQIAVNGARELISINQAVRLGIERLRQSNWVNPLDHIKLDLLKRGEQWTMGPWLHFYAPFNKECNGRDPVDMLAIPPIIDLDAVGMLPYTGPLPDSAEYQADADKYNGR